MNYLLKLATEAHGGQPLEPVEFANRECVGNWRGSGRSMETARAFRGRAWIAFISADDDGAKRQVETLLTGFGYSVIDLGNLRYGGLIQQAGGPLAGAKFVGGRKENLIDESHSFDRVRRSSSEDDLADAV